MLIKINTLPFFLMVLLGVSYFTYIIPLLLSFGFVIVYVSMATPVQITKVQVQGKYLRWKLGCESVMCFLLYCTYEMVSSSEEAHYLYNGQAAPVILDHFICLFV